jgi:ligand-binding SRPBCC domain-containing protein
MPVFDYDFTVRASLADVAQFHHQTEALKRLTPPPVFVQFHEVEPLGEGSISKFTMWFGPFPVKWSAVHTDVNPERGFTDTQAEHGLLKKWVHTHSFVPEDNGLTRVREHIEYEHQAGLRGIASRLLFAPLMLRLLFMYRKWVAKRALE